MGRDAALALALASLAFPALAAADVETAPAAPAAPSAAEASAILEAAEATVAPADAPGDADPALDATVALHELALAYPELEGRERRRADALLARPTDGAGDPLRDGYPAGAPVASAASAHFCVFWVDAPGFADAPELTDANGIADGDGTPDFVESLLAIAEYSYSIEVAPGPLSWKRPTPDLAGCGSSPSTRSDVYLKQIGDQGLFGYQAVDPGQGLARSQYGYIVLDNDYAKAEYGYDDPAAPASVTFAHEFNHLLQVGYDAFQDTWMLEATATWAEEKVYPEVNDYLAYIPAFAAYPGEPVTEVFPPSRRKSLRIYGAAVWNHWLDSGGGGYGPDAVRRAWEVSDVARPADFALASYGRAITDGGGRGFSREFARFAAATAEWRSGFGGFPDRAAYPEVKRHGSLARHGRKRFRLDHTAYRLLRVQPAGQRLKLTVDVAKGVRAGVSLIARDGDPVSGSVTRTQRFLRRGGRASVRLSHPRRYERVTAVVVNADDRVRGHSGGDWSYSRDRARFRLRLAR